MSHASIKKNFILVSFIKSQFIYFDGWFLPINGSGAIYSIVKYFNIFAVRQHKYIVGLYKFLCLIAHNHKQVIEVVNCTALLMNKWMSLFGITKPTHSRFCISNYQIGVFIMWGINIISQVTLGSIDGCRLGIGFVVGLELLESCVYIV